MKFRPIFKEKIWGGHKIRDILGKDFGQLPNCGETWELSGVEGNISIVSNGPLAGRTLTSIIEEFQGDLVGERIFRQFGTEFPLLVKFIDAAEDLSIQVHPDDELATKRHNGFGKTEMWYILQADPGSSLISGFNQEMTREKYLDHFHNGQLMDILNKELVTEGDVFFLPAGRVHTIGKGLLLAEIQQTSDLTYRIYDFDRTDDQGNKRELHLEAALEAMDFKHFDKYKTSYPGHTDRRVQLVKCPYFTTNKLQLTRKLAVINDHPDSFRIYVCVAGEGAIVSDQGKTTLVRGEVALVPAAMEHFEIATSGGITLLESYIEG